jgi:Uma2 family endonuclease
MAQQMTLPPLVRGQWFPMTAEEFDAWVPEGMRAEWYDGKGMIFVSTGTWHGLLVFLFADLLRRCCDLFDLGQVFLGPVELRLPSGARFEPDVFVVVKRDLGRVHPKWADGPAGLAVEFVSENSVGRDRGVKRRAFEEAGQPEYLMVDTIDRDNEPEFLRLNESGTYDRVQPDDQGRYHSRVLPGFWFHPDWFRQDELPDLDDLMLQIAPEAYAARLLAKIRGRIDGEGRS